MCALFFQFAILNFISWFPSEEAHQKMTYLLNNNHTFYFNFTVCWGNEYSSIYVCLWLLWGVIYIHKYLTVTTCRPTRSVSSSPQRTDARIATPRALSVSPIRVPILAVNSSGVSIPTDSVSTKDCFKLGVSPRKE